MSLDACKTSCFVIKLISALQYSFAVKWILQRANTLILFGKKLFSPEAGKFSSKCKHFVGEGGLSPLILFLILVTLIGLGVLTPSLFLSKVYAAHILLPLAFKKEKVILQFLSLLLIQTVQTAGIL